MWYNKHLRLIRRARRLMSAQQRQLLALELEGFVAVTLHTVTQVLTVPVEQKAGMQAADILREALRDRRRQLKAEAYQLHQDWAESQRLSSRTKRTN